MVRTSHHPEHHPLGALPLRAAPPALAWLALGLLAGCVPMPGESGASSVARHSSAGIKTVELGKPKTGGAARPAMPGENVPAIKIDTVGYPLGWQKIAVFNLAPVGATLKNESGKTVWTAAPRHVEDRGLDAASKDPVWQVDFSEFDRSGRYHFEQGDQKSDSFLIGDDLYREAIVAGLKSFYFQRTRTALKAPYATWKGDAYLRAEASHVHEDVGWDLEDYPKKKKRWTMRGGWHDAGNFDMYVPSTAPSAQALLLAYEWNPGWFSDGQLNIPESGNKIPDILDEARWGLDWILSMQEPDSGAFRHREAVMQWGAEGPADKDMTVRWVAGVSTAATAKGVAVMGLASRLYQRWDPDFARACRVSAQKGWAWLKAHPERVKVDGKGSPQPKWDDEPNMTDVGARMVAAVEIWRTFRDDSALALARKLMAEKEAQPEQLHKGAWANLSRWGLGALAMDEDTPAKLRKEARSRIVAAAENNRAWVEKQDGYRCASGLEDYYWGHNSNLLERAHIFLMAHRLTGEPWMLQMARDQWHWVLGRNPNGYSMITRVGKGPTRFYHMEWGAAEPPPPGFLIGGPNSQNLGFLAPGAPAKAILWENIAPLRSGLPANSMWHWRQEDLWDSGFVPEGQWGEGWWAAIEPDILYSANFVLAGIGVL